MTFFYADTQDELLATRDEILASLESVGLFAAAHKCTFFSREIMWCGKVYSQGRVSHDPVRLQGLSDMRRPETAAELMQFIQAMNWLRTSLPGVVHVRTNYQAYLQLLVGIRNPRNTSTTRMNAKQTLIVQESKANGRLKRLHLRSIRRKCFLLRLANGSFGRHGIIRITWTQNSHSTRRQSRNTHPTRQQVAP